MIPLLGQHYHFTMEKILLNNSLNSTANATATSMITCEDTTKLEYLLYIFREILLSLHNL